MRFTSARQAIHDAYAMNLTSKGFEVKQTIAVRKPDFAAFLRNTHRKKIKKRKQLLAEFNPVGFYRDDQSHRQTINHRICDTVEAGMIIAVVESLPEPIKSWAVWAYGPQSRDYLREQGRFFSWLDRDVENNFAAIDRNYRPATRLKIRSVVAYTVTDYRRFILSGEHICPVKEIIKRCNIQRQNWKRDYQHWHEYYWNLCDTYLDRGCLPVVARVVGRISEG